VIDFAVSSDLTAELECATRSYETEVENDGPKVSKIGQAERRSEVGKGAENRES